MKFNFLKRPFVALLTVPAFISMGIGLLPLASIWIEHQFAKGILSPYVLQIGPDSARSVLSTIAAGSMTALSLTYSLVLLVFTLAAGNIGPRLLKRFTSDTINQVTAGIFGGTFLYALLTILFVEDDFVPKFTITIAGGLAVLSVLQLIFFVRHVSKSVTVDEEIGEITTNLRESLKIKFREQTGHENAESQGKPFENEYVSSLSGYIGAVDDDTLLEWAEKEDFLIRMEIAQGGYVVKGQRLLTSDKKLNDGQVEKCLGAIVIEDARSPENEIDFSTNLLVEIGLRALSPGVNDTFTALASVNSLSGALSEVVEYNSEPSEMTDSEGIARLFKPGISPARLIDQAFSPIRRASASNILMAEGIARALARLYVNAGKEAKEEIKKQVRDLNKVLTNTNQLKTDIESVKSYLPKDLQKYFSANN